MLGVFLSLILFLLNLAVLVWHEITFNVHQMNDGWMDGLTDGQMDGVQLAVLAGGINRSEWSWP
jgi:hypothetical protein